MIQTLSVSKLELFAAAAEFGSLTKAAVMLDTTRSAISRQITVFEGECGGRLFHRTGRGVTLTELGERIFPKVRSLLAEMEELRKEIKDTAGIPSGEVAVGILAAASNTLIPQLFERVRALYPRVMLRIYEGSAGQLDEWLANGRLDVAVNVRQGKSFASNESPLAMTHSCLIGPSNDSLTAGPTVDFAALDGLPLILPGPPNSMRLLIEQLAKARKITLSIVMQADSMSVQTAMVAKHHGYTILPRHAITRDLDAGILTATQIDNPRIDRITTLLTTTQRPMSLASREVARTIRKIAEELTAKKAGVWKAIEL